MRDTTKNRTVMLRTFHYYGRACMTHKWVFIGGILATLGYVFFLSYGNSYIVALIIDRVSEGSCDPSHVLVVFGPYLIAFIACNIVGQICSKLQDYTVSRLEIGVDYELATLCFDTLCSQSMTFHTNRFGGSLVSQTTKFLSAFDLLAETLIYSIIPFVSSVVFTIVMLIPSVPLFSLVVAVFVVIYLIVVYGMFKTVQSINADAASAENALSGELSDAITNILAVKTCGREDFERSLFEEANCEVVRTGSERVGASIRRAGLSSAIIVVIMSVVALFVAGGNAYFGITPGVLVMMFNYSYSLTNRLNMVNSTFMRLNRCFGDAHDMTLILDEEKLVEDAPDAAPIEVSRGEIEFIHLDFHYADASEQEKVFEDFNLSIPAGQRVGLVGTSGSGKTTLTTLLLRLADVSGGHILVDGQDISRSTQQSLRRQMAYVPQEPLLFHRTIAENIAYGRPEATFEEIYDAADKAHALEFIERLPHGFDTITGERGVKLSGGQRQRIAIARAILMNAPILVLDEATSALDSESEKLIQDALASLMEAKTSLVIAHRLSTVASLDRIVVISDGRIVEDGTHAELIDAGGEYARLWSRQSGAFLGGE